MSLAVQLSLKIVSCVKDKSALSRDLPTVEQTISMLNFYLYHFNETYSDDPFIDTSESKFSGSWLLNTVDMLRSALTCLVENPVLRDRVEAVYHQFQTRRAATVTSFNRPIPSDQFTPSRAEIDQINALLLDTINYLTSHSRSIKRYFRSGDQALHQLLIDAVRVELKRRDIRMDPSASTAPVYLGANLVNADCFFHVGPLASWRNSRSGINLPGILSFLGAKAFHDVPLLHISGQENPNKYFHVSPHRPGERVRTWALAMKHQQLLDQYYRYQFAYSRHDCALLIAELSEQLRMMKADRESVLQFSSASDLSDIMQRYYGAIIAKTQDITQLLEALGQQGGVEESLSFLMQNSGGLHYEVPGKPLFSAGIVFRYPEALPPFQVDHSPVHTTIHDSNGDWIIRWTRPWVDGGTNLPDQVIRINPNPNNLDEAQALYRRMLCGLYMPHGFARAQADLLEAVLQIPGSPRLPIYDYRGRQIWPG